MTDRPVEEQRAANEYAAKLKTGEDRVLLTEAFLAGVDWYRKFVDQRLVTLIQDLERELKRKD